MTWDSRDEFLMTKIITKAIMQITLTNYTRRRRCRRRRRLRTLSTTVLISPLMKWLIVLFIILMTVKVITFNIIMLICL